MDLGTEQIEKYFQDGMSELEAENYEKAVENLKLAASKNHPKASVELGKLYVSGEGVAASTKEAYALFRSAAEQGDAEAQSLLGTMYLNGDGIEQSNKKAAKWISMAAEQGDCEALNVMGYMYHEGKGFERSLEKALECFICASEKGNDEGTFNAAVMYRDGEGTVKNTEKAAGLFALIADDDPQAALELGLLYMNGDGVEQSTDRAKELFESAYEMGDPNGLYYLALHDNDHASIEDAAQKGSTKAINHLAKEQPERIPKLQKIYDYLIETDQDVNEDYTAFKSMTSE